MKVFRLCRGDEVDCVLVEKTFANVGNYCCDSDRNSHNYKDGVKYMHFFKKQSDLLYLNTFKGRFICVYDIPEDLLLKHYGQGKYMDYISFSSLRDVEEYAIPSENMSFNYLQSIDKIIEDIDVEDMYDGSILTGLIEEVYVNAPTLE